MSNYFLSPRYNSFNQREALEYIPQANVRLNERVIPIKPKIPKSAKKSTDVSAASVVVTERSRFHKNPFVAQPKSLIQKQIRTLDPIVSRERIATLVTYTNPKPGVLRTGDIAKPNPQLSDILKELKQIDNNLSAPFIRARQERTIKGQSRLPSLPTIREDEISRLISQTPLGTASTVATSPLTQTQLIQRNNEKRDRLSKLQKSGK